jgi:uncharacterized protein YjdB
VKHTKKALWIFAVLTAMVFLIAGCGDPNGESGSGISVEGVTLNETGEKTLNVGETFELRAAIEPPDAGNKSVIWRSLQPAVAAVFEDGLSATVLAVSSGTTIIMVVTEDGGKIASYSIKVP